MIRVGIIGSENSHAAAFTKEFNFSGKYDDIRVVGLWGEDAQANDAQCREFGVASMQPEDMLGKVDALMVTCRRGDLHLPYAEPFLKAGMPVFVDKPFAMSADAARRLAGLIEQYGCPCVGGSSTRMAEDTLRLRERAQKGALGGYIYAPVNLKNPYGDFWFYASHLCEIALTVFGYDPVSVQARITETGAAAMLHYAGFSVSLGFTEGVYDYGGTVITRDGVFSCAIDISQCYNAECAEFAHMARTGKTPQPLRELIAPVYLIEAILRSQTSGKAEKIYVD